MDFFEVIEKRRSVRRFTERNVEPETIDRILEAALKAPSAKNCRSTRFLAITNREIIKQIAKMRDFGSAFLTDTPAVIVVMGDKSVTDLWVDDCAISATFVQLSAQALGVANCWVHVNGRQMEHDNPQSRTAEEYLRDLLPIPSQCGVLCVVALGYAAAEPKPLPPFDKSNVITKIC